MVDSSLRNRFILVVEDEFLLASELAFDLEGNGAVVVGPVGSIEEGLALCSKIEKLDGAVLDINLRGQMVFPLSDSLSARGVPFLFTTGYDAGNIPTQYKHVIRCEKPIDANMIVQALSRMLNC